jgi:enoyl-CoA hydratase/carnithine racemase
MSHELPDAIRLAGRMAEVRAIVLTWAGRAFSAGRDMSEIKHTQASFADVLARDLVFGLLDCEKPAHLPHERGRHWPRRTRLTRKST